MKKNNIRVKKSGKGITKSMAKNPTKNPVSAHKPEAEAKVSPLLYKAKSVAQTMANKIKAMAPKSIKKTTLTKVVPVKSKKVAEKISRKVTAKNVAGKMTVKTAEKVLPAKMTQPVKPIAGKKEIVHAGKSLKKETAAPTAEKTIKGAVPFKGQKEPAVAVLVKPAKLTKTAAKAAAKAALVAEHNEKMCRENTCENLATTKGYCRLDYIKNWKKIKRKEMILKEGKLNQYIEELVSKYPDKYIDIIRQDLCTEVNFNKVIHDLELDESIDDLDYDGDSIDSLIGAIRKDSEGFGEDEF